MVLLDPVTPVASEAIIGLDLEAKATESPIKKKITFQEPPKER